MDPGSDRRATTGIPSLVEKCRRLRGDILYAKIRLKKRRYIALMNQEIYLHLLCRCKCLRMP